MGGAKEEAREARSSEVPCWRGFEIETGGIWILLLWRREGEGED